MSEICEVCKKPIVPGTEFDNADQHICIAAPMTPKPVTSCIRCNRQLSYPGEIHTCRMTPRPTTKPVDPLEQILEKLSNLFPEWGKYLGVRADTTTVPIYDWEHKELHKYELEAVGLLLPKIQALIDAARVDELKRFTSSTGKRMKAETWQDWSWRVYHYCKDRIAQLTKSKEVV